MLRQTGRPVRDRRQEDGLRRSSFGSNGYFTECSSADGAAQGAVLYDATHNQFLFSKNADTQYYPASITKLMTALLVAENCNLSDTVTFSQTAVSNLESGAVTLQVKAGDTFTVKDCLYGLLLKSANEVANGLAEHVSGSVSAFADKMNEKAASLGCTHTHFANPNGLNNANHFTTAHDMALIANAAFNNATVRQVASTLHYDFPATASVPTVRTLTMGHKMLNPANSQYYEGIIGGKTGYTSLAGNTLVTCAERNGVRLIAVILKSSQTHYDDTKKLLDYGFAVAGSAPAHRLARTPRYRMRRTTVRQIPASRPAIRPVQIPRLPAARVDRVALELAIQLLRATVRGSSLEMNGNT